MVGIDGMLLVERMTRTGRGRPLMDALREVPDPRGMQGKRYELCAILTLSVCAMLCGSRSLYAIAQWGRDHGPAMAEALGFRRRKTPCVASLHLLFKRLDAEKFEEALGRWFQEQGLAPGEGVAVDGKGMRGIHGEELPGVHLVAAYAHHAGTVLAQKGGKEQGG
jgi:hypothetical protein